MYRSLLGKSYILILFCVCQSILPAFAVPALAQPSTNDSNAVTPSKLLALTARRLGVEDGLSQATVADMQLDKQGFVWLATQDGLNRYDGVEFRNYFHDYLRSDSISGNDIRCIYQDSEGTLWFCVYGRGISRYQPASDNFSNINIGQLTGMPINNRVLDIVRDNTGSLWLATLGGLVRFDDATGQTTLFKPDDTEAVVIRSLLLSSTNQLLLATRRGLYHFDKNFQFHRLLQQYPKLERESFANIWMGKNNNLWLSGFVSGLLQLDLDEGKIRQIEPFRKNSDHSYPIRVLWQESNKVWYGSRSHPLTVFDLADNSSFQASLDLAEQNFPLPVYPTSYLQDNNDLVWVGDWGRGIAIHNPASKQIRQLKFNGSKQLPIKNIWSATSDEKGRLFFAGTGMGIIEYSVANNNYKLHLQKQKINNIWALKMLNSSTLAVGTFYNGLYLYDLDEEKIVSHFSQDKPQTGLNSDSIISLNTDQNGRLLVGTRVSGAYIYDDEAKTFKKLAEDLGNSANVSSGAQYNAVYQIVEDNHNNLLLATEKGLQIKSLIGKTTQLLDVASGLPSEIVTSVAVDSNGDYWIGTDSGLAHWSNNKVIKVLTVNDGLKNNSINDIKIDCDDHVWLATNRGLARVSVDNNRYHLRTFGTVDGVMINEFNFGATAIDKNCNIYFGGMGGVVRVDPDIINAPKQSALVITQYLKSFQPQSSPNIDQTYKASYKDPVVSFQFRLLDFVNPEAHQFAYRLDRQKEWFHIGNRRQIDLSNLDSGEHHLLIRGQANAAQRPTQKQLKILISTPPWQTPWAYISYILALMFAVAFYLYRQREKLKEQQAIALREKNIAQQLRQADKIKDQLLVNTSHELKTPLNAIIGLSSILVDKEHSGIEKTEHLNQLNMIKQSGEHLLDLVTDLLDMSSISHGHIRLDVKAFDICELVEICHLEFSQLNNKPIAYRLNFSDNSIRVIADRKRVHQIINNLLSNASKFTQRGDIVISIKTNQKFALVSVADSGLGIPDSHLGTIFERFKQVDQSASRTHSGFGLGLAICKELVELQGGEISVASSENVGTTVSFSIPLAD